MSEEWKLFDAEKKKQYNTLAENAKKKYQKDKVAYELSSPPKPAVKAPPKKS
jgi:hypothetical protein